MTLKKMSTFWIILLVVAAMHDQICVANIITTAGTVNGVCLGMNGNDLPPATDIINLYHRYNINYMRLFEPVPDVMKALSDSHIYLFLGVRNEDVPIVAASVQAAYDWIINFRKMMTGLINIPYITVGNEIVPGEFAQYIPQAMINLKSALMKMGIPRTMVTTVVSLEVLAASYPPSAGAFTDAARPFMVDILRILSQQRTPILINVYPYSAYASNPAQVSLDYALFNAQGPVVQDGPYSYSNLYDAMVDAFISAMEREGITDVGTELSESGWPSSGNGEMTTPEIAGTYNRNLARHLLTAGTPKRPSGGSGGILFAMFEENLKPGPDTERHFGLFFPNMEPVYPIPVFTPGPPITNANNNTLLDNNGISFEAYYY